MQREGSHFKVWRFISMVLLALVTSVTCTPPFTPPVSFYSIQRESANILREMSSRVENTDYPD